MVKKAKTQQGE